MKIKAVITGEVPRQASLGRWLRGGVSGRTQGLQQVGHSLQMARIRVLSLVLVACLVQQLALLRRLY